MVVDDGMDVGEVWLVDDMMCGNVVDVGVEGVEFVVGVDQCFICEIFGVVVEFDDFDLVDVVYV